MFQLRGAAWGAGALGAARRVPLLSQAEASTPVSRISQAVLKHSSCSRQAAKDDFPDSRLLEVKASKCPKHESISSHDLQSSVARLGSRHMIVEIKVSRFTGTTQFGVSFDVDGVPFRLTIVSSLRSQLILGWLAKRHIYIGIYLTP